MTGLSGVFFYMLTFRKHPFYDSVSIEKVVQNICDGYYIMPVNVRGQLANDFVVSLLSRLQHRPFAHEMFADGFLRAGDLEQAERGEMIVNIIRQMNGHHCAKDAVIGRDRDQRK